MRYAMCWMCVSIKNKEYIVELNTFSIAAYHPDEDSFGVAVSTARPTVGNLVPFVSAQGAIATQARVNTNIGRHGLALLDAGVPLDVALTTLLKSDDEAERRQVHAVTRDARFVFTGERCVPWAGHHMGEHFTVAGNMLAGPQVVEAMASAYSTAIASGQELSNALVSALETGQATGGDKRGKQSAALLVVSPNPRMYHNLRVDDHADPVAELRRLYGVVTEQSRQIEREYGTEGLRLFSQIKL